MTTPLDRSIMVSMPATPLETVSVGWLVNGVR